MVKDLGWLRGEWFDLQIDMLLCFFAFDQKADVHVVQLQIWMVLLFQVCIHWIAARLFTWLVSVLFFILCMMFVVDLKLLYIWSEGCSRLPSFLAFARRHCGLIKPTIHPGEACARASQCWRRQELQSILVSRIFWCTRYSTRLAAGKKQIFTFSYQVLFKKIIMKKEVSFITFLHSWAESWTSLLQIENLRKHVHNSGLFKRIDLVIASPLLRYCCTCSADSLLWISCHVLVLRCFCLFWIPWWWTKHRRKLKRILLYLFVLWLIALIFWELIFYSLSYGCCDS